MKTRVSSNARMRMATDKYVAGAILRLSRLVAAVKRTGDEDSNFSQALDVLRMLSKKEGIPIAIVGGMAAIRHGYERLTNDLDIVIGHRHLNTIIRIAPGYGIKVVWKDPNGWHKLQYEGVRIEIVPEGGLPSKNAPTRIPGPRELGVSRGLGYASLEGWVETKLSSGRRQDQANVVQILKKSSRTSVNSIREHLNKIHTAYVREFEELVRSAEEEKQQESERGGMR